MVLTNFLGRKLKGYADLVIFRHTIFALPFAYMSMFLAAEGLPSWHIFFWITVAMVGARNGANAFNRLVDAKIDYQNPRTRKRKIPEGVVSKLEALALSLLGLVLLVIAAYQLNDLAVRLLPLGIVLMLIYSFTKRYTWKCHFYLGLALAGAPIGAWVAVRGTLDYPAGVLGLAVAFWVAGFDIIYGSQDYEHDLQHNLYSVPAYFGLPLGLWIAKMCHLATVLLLLHAGFYLPVDGVYFLGVALVGGLLFLEHWIISPTDRSRVTIASYQINEIVGPLMLLAVIVDLFFF